MAKAKEKATPQRSTPKKSDKPRKAPKPAPPKASNLSQKLVADSEDEDAPPEDRSIKKVTAQPIASKTKSSAQKAPPLPKLVSDSEKSSEGEDSEEDLPQDPIPKKPDQVPAKVNGVKRKSSEPSSSEEGSEEESEEESEEPDPKRAKTNGVAEEKENSEDEGGVPQQVSKQPLPTKSRSATTAPASAQAIPAPPYEPPSGYFAVDLSKATSGSPISVESFAGKQIWHITAPSDVPLSSVTEVALDAIQSGKPLLNHKGTDYILSEDTTSNGQESVLLPGADGYTPVQQRVAKTLHLQQKVTLPNLSRRQASQMTGSNAAADVAEAAVKTVRPQPKGLRMRFKPPGFGTGKPGMIGSSSDSEKDGEPSARSASFQFPRALGAHGASEFQAREGAAKAPEADASAKKPKKKRKDKQKDPSVDTTMIDEGAGEANAGAEVSHQKGTTETVAATPAKKVVAPEAAETRDVEMTNGVTPEKLSKEEKARRNEEKRKKKEAKMKAKEAA